MLLLGEMKLDYNFDQIISLVWQLDKIVLEQTNMQQIGLRKLRRIHGGNDILGCSTTTGNDLSNLPNC